MGKTPINTPHAIVNAMCLIQLRPCRQSARTPAMPKATTAGNINGPIEKDPSTMIASSAPVTTQVKAPQRYARDPESRQTAASPTTPSSPTASNASAGRGHSIPPNAACRYQTEPAIATRSAAPNMARNSSRARRTSWHLGWEEQTTSARNTATSSHHWRVAPAHETSHPLASPSSPAPCIRRP